MEIKRFIARDVRYAMQMIKAELGSNAVIVSNRSIDEGVEIVAAKDFDGAASSISEQFMRDEVKSLKTVWDVESPQSQKNQDISENRMRADLFHQLADMGISNKLAVKLANQLENYQAATSVVEKVKSILIEALPVAKGDFISEGGIVALVGATGVGKTTTIVKLAANFMLKHGAGSVALITTDNYKVGAHEQLSTYGRLLNIPVRVAEDAETLRSQIDYFYDKKLVIIDTAGMSPRDRQLADQIHTLQQHNVSIKTYLVMSASTQQKALDEIVRAFDVFKPVGCILTKLDETVSLGSTLSTIIEHQLPLSFVSNGQKVPEDIYFPNAAELINQCVVKPEVGNDFVDEFSHEWWMAEGCV